MNINDQESDMANVGVVFHKDLLLDLTYLYYISMTFVTHLPY